MNNVGYLWLLLEPEQMYYKTKNQNLKGDCQQFNQYQILNSDCSQFNYYQYQEFEDTKGIIRICKSKKDRQHNWKKTNSDLQNTT